ncbi:MAG: lysophospholipid acyltransferase family protein [Oscillospiraceae bacterium]|nr:lysophospholipid acyltransferase family protein [Oscillospiraceae bacterium]
MFYCIMVPLAWLVWHLAFRIKVVGRENIVRDRPVVIICNHLSAIDPVFLILARFWGKRMIILAKEELFQKPFPRWFLLHVGVIPIGRGKGDTGTIDKVIAEVKGGRTALIFPEGTRSKDGSLQRLKSGAFVVAQQAGADILPARIIYRGGKMRVFHRATVVFGKCIPLEELGLTGEEHSAAVLRGAKARVTAELEKLLEENREYC